MTREQKIAFLSGFSLGSVMASGVHDPTAFQLDLGKRWGLDDRHDVLPEQKNVFEVDPDMDAALNALFDDIRGTN